MILGIDLDNVLSQTDTLIRAIISRLTGQYFHEDQVIAFSYATALSIDKKVEQAALDAFHSHHCEEVLPFDGAQDAIARLCQMADVKVLTSRPYSTVDCTNRWLAHYFPQVGDALFADGYTKADICQRYEVQVVIEDNGETARELAANHVSVMLLDRPWNRSFDGQGIIRVRDWPDIYRQLVTKPVFCKPLMPALTDLADQAKQATTNTYSPYSNFEVGTALKLIDGRVITGCNIENASYSLAMCAERTTVFKAVSEGAHQGDLVALAIAARPKDGIWTFTPPCGACRQVINQFSHARFPTIIIVLQDNGEIDIKTLDDYLPYPFRL